MATRRRHSEFRFDWRTNRNIINIFDWRCACCGKVVDKGIGSFDHVVALTQGGLSTLDNVQVLCDSCNSRKSTRTIDYRTPGQKKALATLTSDMQDACYCHICEYMLVDDQNDLGPGKVLRDNDEELYTMGKEYFGVCQECNEEGIEVYGSGEDQISFDSAMYRD